MISAPPVTPPEARLASASEATLVPTVAIPNFLITQSKVPDELVYQMAKAMYGNLDTLYAAHNAAKAIKLQNALTGMPIPLHPGAERYFREAGILK